MTARRRLDAELVRRGLAESRSRATEIIGAGRVLVGGAVATKPARMVAPGEPVLVQDEPPPYVSRGGRKLAAALDRWPIVMAGRRVIDVGSSTGGFTDCALQHGAAEVVAIDVGRAQLHERLRRDERVAVHERTNVRGLDPGTVGGPGDVVVSDLSFISLRTVAPDLVRLCRRGGDLVVLVKPQFEVGREQASKGKGVIRDPVLWRMAIHGVMDAFFQVGAVMMGVMPSPITGARGNVEFLAHFRAPTTAPLSGTA